MEKLDDFMRDKFNSDDPAGRFEFQEAYWDQARVLLEADEARRKKRRWFWLWWLVPGVVALGLWWMVGKTDGRWRTAEGERSRVLGSGQETVEGGRRNEAGSGQTADHGPQNADSRQESGKTGQESAPGNAAGQAFKDSGKRDKDDLKGASKSGAQLENAQKNKDKTRLTDQLLTNQQTTEGKSFSTSGKATKNKSVANKPAEPAVASLKAKEPEKTSRSADAGNTRVKSPDPVGNAKPEVNALAATAGHTNTEASEPFVPASAIIPSMPRPAAVGLLPLLASQPVHPDTSTVLTMPHVAEAETVIKKKPQRAFRLQFDAAGAFYPGIKSTNQWGATVALSGVVQIKPTVALSAGIGLRQVPDNSFTLDNPDQPGQQAFLRYDFGFHSDVYMHESRSLYALEVPVRIYWTQPKWGVQAGFAPSMLLASRDKLVHESSSSLALTPVTETKKEFRAINTAYYRKYGVSVSAGVYRNLNNWLGVYSQAGYQLSKRFDRTSDGVSGKPGASWWIEAGIRLRF
jgi:hypothetical protein